MAQQQTTKAKGAYPVAQFLPPVNPFLGLIPKKYWKRIKDFFIYGVEFIPIVHATTLTQPVTIQNDSDFLIMGGVYVETTTDNVTTFFNPSPLMVTIADSGSGRQLMNIPVHINNLFGTAQLPAIWPFPKIIPAGATLNTTLTNQDTANDRNVRIAYWGFKIFAFEESQPSSSAPGAQ